VLVVKVLDFVQLDLGILGPMPQRSRGAIKASAVEVEVGTQTFTVLAEERDSASPRWSFTCFCCRFSWMARTRPAGTS
jgi:hypothetical protein